MSRLMKDSCLCIISIDDLDIPKWKLDNGHAKLTVQILLSGHPGILQSNEVKPACILWILPQISIENLNYLYCHN